MLQRLSIEGVMGPTSKALTSAVLAWSAVLLLAADDRRLKVMWDAPSVAITEPAGGGMMAC